LPPLLDRSIGCASAQGVVNDGDRHDELGQSAGAMSKLGLTAIGCFLLPCTGLMAGPAEQGATLTPSNPPTSWRAVSAPDREQEFELERQSSAARGGRLSHLKLTSETYDYYYGRDAKSHPRELNRRSVAIDSDGAIGRDARFGFNASVADSLRTTDAGPSGLIAAPLDWRQNRAASSKLSLGLLDDRLRLTTTQAFSDFDGTDIEHDQGTAFSQRAEFDLIRNGSLRLSTFAAHSIIEEEFTSMGLRGGSSAFGRDDGQTVTFGSTVTAGPFSLTLTREDRDSLGDDEAGTVEEMVNKALINLSLQPLEDLTAGVLGETFWHVMPDSFWFSLAQGSVLPRSEADERDRTIEQGFGLSWSGDSAYSEFGFWHFTYDGRQSGAREADWLGYGLSFDTGIHGKMWNLDATLAYNTGRNEEVYSRSVDDSYDGSLFFSYRPERLPDWIIGLSAGHYRTDYIAYGDQALTNYRELSVELDLAKFWPISRSGHHAQGLRAVYWLRDIANADDLAGNDREREHVVGILFSMQF
jgi:hypothetical protein